MVIYKVDRLTRSLASARWSAVGTYSAGISRSVSFAELRDARERCVAGTKEQAMSCSGGQVASGWRRTKTSRR
jgi:hypothetical protein